MLDKLADNEKFQTELDEIASVRQRISNEKTQQTLDRLTADLKNYVNLCDEYHLSENRKFVSIPMIQDVRTNLVNTRQQIQDILKQFK